MQMLRGQNPKPKVSIVGNAGRGKVRLNVSDDIFAFKLDLMLLGVYQIKCLLLVPASLCVDDTCQLETGKNGPGEDFS